MCTEDYTQTGTSICGILFGAFATFHAKQGFKTNVHMNFLFIRKYFMQCSPAMCYAGQYYVLQG